MPSVATRVALLNSTYRTGDGTSDKLLAATDVSTVHQPVNATLTALSSYNTVGLVVQSSTVPAFTGRTLTAGSTRVTIVAGSGSTGNPTVDLASFPSTFLSDTANLARLNVASTWASTQTFVEVDVQGPLRCDSFRIDVSPTAEAIVPTHTITFSVNGTNYKIPIVAA